MRPDVDLPHGFVAHVGNIGIKDDQPDVMLLTATGQPAIAAGVFTQSLFSGPSVTLSRKNIADNSTQAVVIVARNANVATGAQGEANAAELGELTAAACGCDPADVLVGSTGVIGVQYPMQRVRDYFTALGALPIAVVADLGTADLGATLTKSAFAAASAIMTTDTYPKVSEAFIGSVSEAPPGAVTANAATTTATGAVTANAARVVGFAKGVGMIEPDMATMIAVITTDAAIPADLSAGGADPHVDSVASSVGGAGGADPSADSAATLDAMFRRVVDRTFNALSIDTDTSTSDMAIVLASGAAGPVDPTELEAALLEVCTDLTRQLAADGEGAQTLIVVNVDQARDQAQAKRIGKSIVNSPLVKAAVHGRDPNWGRVAMAIGKCQGDQDINQDQVVIAFGKQEVYPTPTSEQSLERLASYLDGDEVHINISLSTGAAAFTVYGCDLTDGYVRINADYTT